jgi:hypothetical protein
MFCSFSVFVRVTLNTSGREKEKKKISLNFIITIFIIEDKLDNYNNNNLKKKRLSFLLHFRHRLREQVG